MKKLFTLVALLACFLGAKADWVEDYSIDYSSKSNFPFYVMGYVPEWYDGIMTDFGADYRYATQADLDGDGDAKWKDGESSVGSVTAGSTEYQKVTGAGPYWHQYFIADGINTGDMADTYIVKAWVRASAAVTINVNMGWGWGSGEQVGVSVNIPQSEEFVEVEWEYNGIGGASCNLVAQPGTATAVIEWKSLTVGHNAKASRPVTWQEWLTSDGQPVIVETTSAAIPTWMGNAETPWADAEVKFNDQENNYLICAWSKEKGRNLNDDSGWDPFPADIEVDEKDPNNHVFVCHGQPATTEGDASSWDNQFWIQSPKAWKAGEQIKVHFRYRASADVSSTDTQIHLQNPSNYLIWHAIGNIAFTQDWQEFDGTMSIADDMAGGWSIAFNLNSVVKDAVNFYFDDLSWQTMKLDEGFFVAGANPDTGLAYDFDTAIQFEEDPEEEGVFIATIGEAGNKDSYVSQIMISTVRGNDASFKANTLNRTVSPTNDPDDWQEYTAKSNNKMTLPGSGVWKIWIDTNYTAMAFEMLEGEVKDPIDVVTNTTELIVNAVERDWLTADNDGNPREAEIGKGEGWDNQFWIVANRTLAKGEVTHLKFSYKANKEAKTSTQCHGNPGGYLHWAAIGDVIFNTEWQEFDADFTVPAEGDGMQSIAFNMAEIKEACNYEIKDVQWYLKADGLDEGKTWENLIDETGTKNFWLKISAGTDPYQYDPLATGISTIATEKNAASAVIVNLAGQRVSNGYKGIVIKNGKKVVLK
jgi:hypothetical protein